MQRRGGLFKQSSIAVCVILECSGINFIKQAAKSKKTFAKKRIARAVGHPVEIDNPVTAFLPRFARQHVRSERTMAA